MGTTWWFGWRVYSTPVHTTRPWRHVKLTGVNQTVLNGSSRDFPAFSGADVMLLMTSHAATIITSSKNSTATSVTNLPAPLISFTPNFSTMLTSINASLTTTTSA